VHDFVMKLKVEQLPVVSYYKLCRRKECEVENSFP